MELQFGDSGTPVRTIYKGYGGVLYPSEEEARHEAGDRGYIAYPFCLTDAGLSPSPPAWRRDGKWYASSVMALPGLPGQASPMINRPVHDTRKSDSGGWYQEVDESYWTLHGVGSGYDVENWTYEGQSFPPRMFYKKANMGDPSSWTYLKSKFELPTQPIFSLLLRSMVPTSKEEWNEAAAEGYYKYVKFGKTSSEHYLLHIPAGRGPISLYWKHDQKTDGKYVELTAQSSFSFGRSETDLSGDQEEGDLEYIWVMSAPTGILVGNKGMSAGVFFQSPKITATYDQTHKNEALVKPGPIEVGYNGGKWECGFVPIWMPPVGYYQTPVMGLPYPWDSNTHEIDFLVHGSPVVDYEGGSSQWAETEPGSGEPATVGVSAIMGESATDGSWASRVDAGERKHEYLIQIKSSKTVDSETGLIMYRSPVLYRMRYDKVGYVDSLTPINYTNIEGDELSVSIDKDIYSPSGSVVVDNQTGGWADFLDDWTPRRVRVRATWIQKSVEDGS